jgi:hypothetical protein
MITSVPQKSKSALTGKGLAGYTLVEYGTALAWASDLDEDNPLILGQPYTKSNYAYKKDVADPIFANTFSSKMPPFFDEKLPKKPYFLVSLRSIRGENSVDLEKLSKVLRRLSREGFLPVFVSMQDSFDLEISRRAARLTDGISIQIKDAEELYFLLEKASFAIGMRLHFLLTAAMAGTPFVPLSYDPKIEGCLRALGAFPSVSAFDFCEEELFSLIKNQRESFSKSDTEAACRRLRMLAEGDFDAVVSLLRSKESTAEKFYADT